MPHIAVLYPEEDRQIVQIPKTGLLIGRSSSCGLRLKDEFVSAEHCRISVENGGFFVEDLGSTNGTLIDGEQIDRKSPLSTEQKVHIGVAVISILPP
ncbi:MAG: FHA domain-containing protein [Fibromonadales bacterium]|nr:FHA domain-containing protein [Fibromonadales bacterium]